MSAKPRHSSANCSQRLPGARVPTLTTPSPLYCTCGCVGAGVFVLVSADGVLNKYDEVWVERKRGWVRALLFARARTRHQHALNPKPKTLNSQTRCPAQASGLRARSARRAACAFEQAHARRGAISKRRARCAKRSVRIAPGSLGNRCLDYRYYITLNPGTRLGPVWMVNLWINP